MDSLKKRIESPSFWLSILGGIGTIAAGLTDTGNPTLIAIGSALIAVHAIGEALVEGVKIIAPAQNVVSEIGEKAAALVPVVEHQVANVQTLIKTVGDQAKILSYRLKGYEVTPHVDVPVSNNTSHTLPGVTVTNSPNIPNSANLPNSVGGGHEIIGVKKP